MPTEVGHVDGPVLQRASVGGPIIWDWPAVGIRCCCDGYLPVHAGFAWEWAPGFAWEWVPGYARAMIAVVGHRVPSTTGAARVLRRRCSRAAIIRSLSTSSAHGFAVRIPVPASDRTRKAGAALVLTDPPAPWRPPCLADGKLPKHVANDLGQVRALLRTAAAQHT
jgi:hypothetical protein